MRWTGRPDCPSCGHVFKWPVWMGTVCPACKWEAVPKWRRRVRRKRIKIEAIVPPVSSGLPEVPAALIQILDPYRMNAEELEAVRTLLSWWKRQASIYQG